MYITLICSFPLVVKKPIKTFFSDFRHVFKPLKSSQAQGLRSIIPKNNQGMLLSGAEGKKSQ